MQRRSTEDQPWPGQQHSPPESSLRTRPGAHGVEGGWVEGGWLGSDGGSIGVSSRLGGTRRLGRLDGVARAGGQQPRASRSLVGQLPPGV